MILAIGVETLPPKFSELLDGAWVHAIGNLPAVSNVASSAAREVVVLPDGQIIAVGVKPLPWRRSADPA